MVRGTLHEYLHYRKRTQRVPTVRGTSGQLLHLGGTGIEDRGGNFPVTTTWYLGSVGIIREHDKDSRSCYGIYSVNSTGNTEYTQQLKITDWTLNP